MSEILDMFKKRRSIYVLGKNITLSQSETAENVKQCIKNAPSAFNSQTARAVVLFGSEHQKLWQIVLSHLQKVTPAGKFGATQNKITSFAEACGTVLFFEDMAAVEELQKQYPLYYDAFPVFSCQSSGMAQYMVWTMFASENIGASLQHYNPLIDDDVKKEFNLPASWKLMSQMPFGSIEAAAGEKSFLPLENRVLIKGL